MEQVGVIVFGLKGCGKSTLCGHMLYRYGLFSDNALKQAKSDTKKLNKENCEYAFLCNSKDSDRKKGTSETKIFELTIGKQVYNLIDSCPATHDQNQLIRHGFGQSRIGVLILEAYKDKDVFNGLIDKKSDIHQQVTMTHTLGVQQLIICINKIDKDEFTQDLYNAFCEKINLMLTIIGYNPTKVPIIPICSYSGDNLFQPSEDPSLNWWKEKGFKIKSTSNNAKTHKIISLMKAIKYMRKKVKPLNTNINTKNLLCMTIKSRTENKQIAPIFSARVDIGQININQTVLCCKSTQHPLARLVRKYNIKSIQSHNKHIKTAQIGTVIEFTFSENINDIPKKEQPEIGDIICNGNEFKMSLYEAHKNQIDYTQCLPNIIKYDNTFIALIVMLPQDIVNKTTLKIEPNKFDNNLIFRTQTLNCSLLSIFTKGNRNNNILEEKKDFNELTNGEEAEVIFGMKDKHFVSKYDVLNSYSRFFIMKDKMPIAIGKVIGIGKEKTHDVFEWKGGKCMKNTCIGRVSICNEFVVEFTMIIHGKKGNDWENILHIGQNNNVRSPGFWLHPGSYKLHVRLSDANDWNKGYDPNIELKIGERYNIRLDSMDSFVEMRINDTLYTDGESEHKEWYMAPIWVSDPWYDAADVTIENLKIYVPD